jgi:hypothetical protein
MLPFSRNSASACWNDGFRNSLSGICAEQSGKSQIKVPSLARTSADGGDISKASNMTASV